MNQQPEPQTLTDVEILSIGISADPNGTLTASTRVRGRLPDGRLVEMVIPGGPISVGLPEDATLDSPSLRERTTHGWEHRDLSPDTQKDILAYLRTGDPDHLGEGSFYRVLRDGMYGRGER